jgi:peroxiredoxin
MSTPDSSTKESGPKTGELAPDFTLPVTPDQHLSLSDLKGGSVVLAFYPADWSPVCSDQLALYNQILPEFHRRGAQLVGISTDSAWCHAAFAADRKLHEQEGTSERALFVIDAAGTIRWSYVSPLGINPGADGILDALDAIAEAPNSRGDQR